MRKVLLCLLAILLLPSVSYAKVVRSSGKKPAWMIKGTDYLESKRSNDSYYFKNVPNVGSNLQELQERKNKALGDRIASDNKLEGAENLGTINVQNGSTATTVSYTDNVTNQRKTKTFYSKVVDEYWEWDGYEYKYNTLFAVSENENYQFDNFSTTTSYGAGPVVMSIIPGVGQMYKGSTTKGICLLGGTAALAVGGLFCDNERADYRNKVKEQPQYAQTYNTRANNYETARNVCLGAAAAIWLYNIIDAAVAKGNRRIIVRPSTGKGLAVSPMISPEGNGVRLAYNF